MSDILDRIDALYCGCCGNEIGRSTKSGPDWCARCKPHVRPLRTIPPWERTYFAQYHRDCPFQVSP